MALNKYSLQPKQLLSLDSNLKELRALAAQELQCSLNCYARNQLPSGSPRFNKPLRKAVKRGEKLLRVIDKLLSSSEYVSKIDLLKQLYK